MGKRYLLRPAQRLRTRTDFQRVRRARCRAANEYLAVYVRPNERPFTRLAVAVGKKLGMATVRNRHKRLLREAFRLSQHELPGGYDLLCVVLRVNQTTLNDYRAWLAELVSQAVRQAEQHIDHRQPRRSQVKRPAAG
jgi:ribonuclease P protein component